MADTPTGTARRGRKRHTNRLRRRIIRKHAEDDHPPETISDEKATEVDISEESTVDESSTSKPSSSCHSLSPSTRRLYVKMCTPSRAKGKTQSIMQRSIYRTPVISSVTKKAYTIKGKKVDQVFTTEWKKDVQSLLNKTWKFCYLSSVFRFNIEKSRLRVAYERTLKAHILSIYPSYHLVVKFSVSSFLSQNPKKVDAILVNVTSLKPGETGEEDKMVTVYHGILIRSQQMQQSKACRGVQWFPLLLYTGLELLHNTFLLWLQASFDCYVTPRCLPTNSILWLTGVWSYGRCSNKIHSREDRKISLHYQIRLPAHPAFDSLRRKGKFSVKFYFKHTNLVKIWAKIRGNVESALNANDLAHFHDALDSVAESLTYIPKGLLQLVHIKTPCIALASSGKLRLTCDKVFNSLLHQLIEIFQCTCHSNKLDTNDYEIEDMDMEEK